MESHSSFRVRADKVCDFLIEIDKRLTKARFGLVGSALTGFLAMFEARSIFLNPNIPHEGDINNMNAGVVDSETLLALAGLYFAYALVISLIGLLIEEESADIRKNCKDRVVMFCRVSTILACFLGFEVLFSALAAPFFRVMNVQPLFWTPILVIILIAYLLIPPCFRLGKRRILQIKQHLRAKPKPMNLN